MAFNEDGYDLSMRTNPSHQRTQPAARRRHSIEPRDSLERELSGYEEAQRMSSEGGVGNLTELAAPDPVDRHHFRKESFEHNEQKEWQNRQRRRSSGADEVYLSELAAPSPVEEEEDTASHDEEAGQASPSPSSKGNEAPIAPKSTPSPHATRLYTIAYLILFSILGTLARLGIEAITRYPQSPFPSVVLWANVGGSLIMGFLAEDRRLFRQEWGTDSEDWSFHHTKAESKDADIQQKIKANHGKVKKTIPLFIGLATGYCGSFTSFSSFMRDAFLALTNDLSSPSPTSPYNTTRPLLRNGGYSFEATLAVLIIEVACSISALHFGAHFALLTDRVTPTLPFKLIRSFVDPLAVVVGFGSWLGAVLLCIWPPANVWRGRVVFALVFAPPGCLLRFYASKFLNARIPSFPLGTFSVNIFGTAILGMCYDLQHARGIGALPGGSVTACQVLNGVMEGFCGCTTTVSTWVAELTGLRRRHAYLYGLTSMVVALGLLVAIMGSVGWTSGFGKLSCSV